MGPRLRDVEDVDEALSADAVDDASMGPRLRDVEDAAAKRSRFEFGEASMGPRLRDVEDRWKICRTIRARLGFNGATSQGRGRLEDTRVSPQLEITLQWGHVSGTWKTRCAVPDERCSRSRFNGATSQGRGRQPGAEPGGLVTLRFNGATSQGRGRPPRLV